MALINCSACRKQVSDKAESCPNCGHPINQQETTTTHNINTLQTPKPERKSPYLGLVAMGVIILIAILPFHYVFYNGRLHVFPKDNFTFSNTVITNEDVSRIIKQYNNEAFIGKLSMRNDPIVKKLLDKGILIEKEY